MDQVLEAQRSTALAADDVLNEIISKMPTRTELEAADARLKKDVNSTITEVMTMHESLSALVQILLEDCDGKAFPILEAADACLDRMGRSIEAVSDRVTSAQWYDL